MRSTPLAAAWAIALAACLLWPNVAFSQSTPHVAVLSVDAGAYAPHARDARAAAARAFYQSHRDAYDFLVLFPTFPMDLSWQSPGEVLGKHWEVRNDVSGIGIGHVDIGAEFGSGARLKGVIDVHSLVPGVEEGSFDATLFVLAHEVAHQWSGRVAFLDPINGSRSTALLGPDGAHWSYALSSNASVLYGSSWRDLGDGTFVAEESRRRYSPLDLYLMGFLAQSEVPPFTLIEPAAGVTLPADGLPPPDGTLLRGTGRTVALADVIAAEGERAPDASSSQAAFRAAFVVLVDSGQAPSPEQLAFVDGVRREWANRFFFMTRGRGVMETELVESPAVAAEEPSPGLARSWLLQQQDALGAWSDDPATRVRDTAAAVEALADQGTVPGVAEAISAAATFLDGVAPLEIDSAARLAISLAAVRGAAPPISTPPSNADGGIGLAQGYESTGIDTALAALAAAASGALDARPELVQFLLDTQRADGGWGYLTDGASGVEPTAWTLQVLRHVQGDTRLAVAAEAGISFLRASQRADGSYGDDILSGPSFTAEAVLALAAWDALGAGPSFEAGDYLLAVQRADGSFDGSVYETALALRALRMLVAPNLAIEEVTVSRASAVEGERIELHAAVRNTGRRAATAVRLQTYDEAGSPFGEGIVVPEVAGGEAVPFDLVLDTSGHAGSTIAFVVVDPDGAIDELREDDNRAAVPLFVAPPPDAADLVVESGSVAAMPPTLDALPSSVQLSATLRNLGTTGVLAANVAVLVRDAVAATAVVDLPARSLLPLTLDVPVSGGPGPVVIRVILDPEDAVPEASEENNDAAVEVPLVPSVDLAISGLVASPLAPEQGGLVTFTWTLRNTGTLAATAVTDRLRMSAADGALAGIVETHGISVPPGGAVPREASWWAGAAGELTVQVDAAHAAERNPADNVATTTIVVSPSTRPNLRVRAEDVTTLPNPPLEGSTFVIRAVVRNAGGVPAGPFQVAFFEGDPAAGRLVSRAPVAGIAGGGTVEVQATYEAASGAEITAVVQIDVDGEVDEYDESDNTVALTLPVLGLPDLQIGDSSIVLSSGFPRVDETVIVTITALNVGGQPSAVGDVVLYDGDPGSGGTLIGGADIPALEAGASADASISWIAAPFGTHQLVAVARSPSTREASLENNRAVRSVSVQDADLASSEPYFSPNGDGIKDETTLLYRLTDAGDAIVEVSDANGRAVRTLPGPVAQTAGGVSWDGRSEKGAVAPDGRYGMTLYVERGGIRTVRGTVDVVLDVNRSALADAAGTPLLDAESLAGRVPEIAYEEWSFAPLPDDSGVTGYGCDALGTCGIYTIPVGGGTYSFVTPPGSFTNLNRPWRMGVSPEGRRIAYGMYPGYGGGELRVYDLAACTFRNFVDPDGVDNLAPFVWSPDGSQILIRTHAGVKAVNVDGSGAVVIHPDEWVAEYSYSPDGAYVSVLNGNGEIRVYRRDGSEGIVVAPMESGYYPDHDLAWRHAWTADGTAIAFVHARQGISYVDLATLEIERLFVAPPEEVRQFEDRSSLAASSRSLAVAFVYEPGGWTDGYGTRVELATGDPPSVRTLYEVHGGDELSYLGWAPLETFAWARRWPHDSSSEGWDIVRSLANLTSRLTTVREPGRSYITFRGTAVDLNFAGFEIRVRRDAPGEEERVVARGSASVVSDILGEWTPARDGVYEAGLVARDLAGNAREHRIRFGWSRSSVISNVRREPEYFSPNGDGIQDAVTLSYAANAPTTFSARIETTTGQALRTLEATHLAAGEYALPWDGRDDLGWLVPDGEYVIRVADQRFRVFVDTVPPDARMELSAALPAEPGTEFGKLRVVGIPQDLGGDLRDDAFQEAEDAFMNVTLQAEDMNLAVWMLEEVAGPEATGGLLLERGWDGIEKHFVIPMLRSGGRTYRLSASDTAGNTARVERLPPERIYAIALGLSDEVFNMEGYLGLAFSIAHPPYRGAPVLFASADPITIPSPGETAGLYPNPERWKHGPRICDRLAARGRLTVFFSESISAPISDLSLSYKRNADSSWTEVPLERPQIAEDQAAIWDSGDLTNEIGVKLKIEATDIRGNRFESPTFEPKCSEPGGGWDICILGDTLRVSLGTLQAWLEASERASLDIVPEDSPTEPVSYVLKEGAGSEITTRVEVEMSQLRGCTQEIRLRRRAAGAAAWEPDESFALATVSGCGAWVGETSVSGTRVDTSIVESHSTPVRDVEIYARRVSSTGPWVLVGRTGPFEGKSPVVRLDTDAYDLCAALSYRLVTVLADGSRIEEIGREDRPPCEQQALALECGVVSVADPVPTVPAARCVSREPTYVAGIAGRGVVPFTDLRASLLTQAGLSVREVPVSGFTPGETFLAAAEISGSGLPDGSYPVGATATDENGKRYDARSAGGVLVDSTPPTALLESPIGGVVCPAIAADGERRIAVSGVARDENFESYTVWLRPADGAGDVAYATGGAAVAGPLAVLDVSSLAAGTYALGFEVRDRGGNAVCPPEVPIEIPAPPTIEDLSAAPAVFSPDGDGTADTVSLSFTPRAVQEVAVALRAGSASPLSITTLPGDATAYSWSGTLADGSVPADGAYAIELSAPGLCGARAMGSVPIEIDTTSPLVRIDQPAPGSTVSTAGAVIGVVADAHLAGYRVSLGEGTNPAEFALEYSGERPAGSLLAALPLADMPPGAYTVLVEGWDTVGHSSSAQATFTWAPGALLEAFDVAPLAVSPNGDGVKDDAVASVRLAAAATVVLDLLAQDGTLVHAAIAGGEGTIGVETYHLGDALAPVPDGSYLVRATARTATTEESATQRLVVDRAPPAVDVTTPAVDAFVRGATEIAASVADETLEEWRILWNGGGTEHLLASGTEPFAGAMASLGTLAEGAHSVVVEATDSAGNRRSVTVPFVSDTTPPLPVLTSPPPGTFVSGGSGSVLVTGALTEINPATWRLDVESASAGARPLAEGTTFPAGGVLFAWDVTSEPEGPAVLRLSAVDRAGNEAAVTVDVVVDNTPPAVAITSPRDTFLHDGDAVVGSVSDPNLESYTVELSDGAPGSAYRFVEIASGDASVVDGTLASLASMPAEGTYTLRLTATDRAGNSASDLAGFVVDRTPPHPPPALVATLRRPSDGVLTWEPSPDVDVVGYRILRGMVGAGLEPIGPALVEGTTWVDPALRDGVYTYAVLAIDESGLVSDPSPEAALEVDTRPPMASISRPAAGARVRGVVLVRGSAFSDTDFREYRLSVGEGAAPAAFDLLRRSPAPVIASELGTLDTTAYAEGTILTLQLEAEDLAGNVAEARATIEVDNLAPPAPVLVSATLQQADVVVTWDPVVAPDLAGYLVWRNGIPASVPEDADLTDPLPFLIPAGVTSWSDRNVPDGSFVYQVQAVDLAANLSDLSNEEGLSIDRRAPTAYVVSPSELARLTAPVDVVAECQDQDVASVQIEARSAVLGGAFVPLGSPLTMPPFVASLDASAFGPVVEVRATATDAGGRVDAAPGSIFVFAAPAISAPEVNPHVDESLVDVAISDPNPAGEVAAFAIERSGVLLNATSTAPQGAASASSTYSGNPSTGNDGRTSSCWWPAVSRTGEWWQEEFNRAHLVEMVSLYRMSGTFDVQLRVQGAWVPIARTQQGGAWSQNVHVSPAVMVDAVRVVFSTTSARICEVIVAADPVSTLPISEDFSHTSEDQTAEYTVSAIGVFGQRATATGSARVYSPVLDVPATPVGAPDAIIAGGNATPGALARVAIAGNAAGEATAGVDGRFAVAVVFSEGDNVVTAQATDALGNRSRVSVPRTVRYEQPPEAQITLALDGMSGSSVALSFTAEGDTSGVGEYELLRASGGAEAPVARAAASERTFLDAGLQNGAYTYRVRPLSPAGVPGTPSNAVQATVNVPVPAAPVLTVSAPARGEALDLVWTFDGVAQFSLERAEEGGAFSVIATGIAGLVYGDEGLTNGRTYRYRVTAVDSVGNAGVPSNEASGTPNDTSAPARPEITEPTVAGQPLATNEARTTVAGLAEIGASVELLQNGCYAGADVADTPVLQPVAVPTALPARGLFDVASTGEPIAYGYSSGGVNGVAAEWPSTGTVFASPIEGLSLSGRPRLSPDGSRLAFLVTGYDYAVSLYLADLATGTVTIALSSDAGLDDEIAWSPDGARLAYPAYRSGSGVGVLDVESGEETFLPAYSGASQVEWIDSGSIGYVTDWLTTLVSVDAASGALEEVARHDWVEAWAPATSTGAIALAGTDSGLDRVWVIDGTGENEVMDDGADSLAFSPDGRELAISRWGNVWMASSPWAAARDVGYASGFLLIWRAPDRLYVSDYGALERLDPVGRFDIPVLLESGLNTFVAFATDSSGNLGEPSEQIDVTLDASAMPDLALEAEILPPVPIVGDAVQAVLRIRNLGAPSLGGIVTAVLTETDGTLQYPPPVSLGPLGSGATTTAFVPLETAASGDYLLTAFVDPAAGETDRNPANNRIDLQFSVLASGGVSMSMTAQPRIVEADGLVAAEIVIRNAGPSRDATLVVQLVDSAGIAAITAPSVPLALPSSGSRTVSVTIPVGSTLAGEYSVNTAVSSGEEILAVASAPVTIAADRAVWMSVVSARAEYGAAEPVALVSRIRNDSRNAPLDDAVLQLEIVDGTGAVAHTLDARPVLLVWMGEEVALSSELPVGTLASGAYTARAVLESGGQVLAEASTAFAIAADPLLAGTVSVAGTPDPPVVRAGTPAIATAVIRNVGTGTALAIRAHLVTVDAGGAEVGRITFDVGDVAPSADSTEEVSVPTATLALGTYGLVLVAEYDGRTEALATAHFRIADGRAPELVLLAPSEGSFVRGAVTPSVRASDDSSGVAAVRGAIGGASVPFALTAGYPLDGTWSGAFELGPDGPYEIVISAADAEGNDGLASPSISNPVLLHLVSDTTAPQVRIDGVVADALVNVVVTPVIVAEDVNLARVDAFLDGASFGGGAVEADGDHVVVAVASDRAGNSSSASIRFSIDRTPPSIAVVGVDEGAFVAMDVTPLIVVTDMNLESYSAWLDGVPFSEGATLTAERTYSLAVTALDRAGNAADLVRTFTIDKTPPVIEIAGVRDGAYVSEAVSPVVTVTDPNLLSSEATLDGEPFAYGSVVSTEGFHRLSVSGLDRAGNRAEVSVSFVIDPTPPSISIDGVAEGEITARDVVPVVIVEDANLSEWTTTVDGVELPLGGAVTFEGEHVLEVVATDLAGNAASATVRFEIDRTAPAIWASVQDGASYDDAVVVEFGATDRNLATVTATLDGGPVQSGVLVDADGAHVLVVEARDAAGNEAGETYGFEIGAVRYTVEKRLLGRHARVLAMIPCESANAERIESFLRAALPGVPLALVMTDVDLLMQLRTGLHDVVVVAGGRNAESDGCEPESAPPPLPPGTLAHRVEQELTEAVFRGLGAIVFREEQAAWPQLAEALGLRFEGDEPAGAVAISASAVAEELRLSVPDGVELKLQQALGIGSFERDDGTAAAIHAFGTGAAATFGFDPSVAEPAAVAERLLAGAVAFVTPDAVPRPLGVVAVGIDVTNERRPTSTRVRETVDSALDVVGVLSGGSRLPTGEIEWQLYQAAGATERLAYVVRLPQFAGTYPTTTEVASVGAAGELVYGTYVLDLVLGRGEAELADDAEQLALALPSQGPDAADRTEILARLAAVEANPGSMAADRERAIGDLLAAIDAARALRTLDPTPLRLALDELLVVWEARP